MVYFLDLNYFGQYVLRMKQWDKETTQHVMNILRQGTIKWEGRKECLRRARKKVLEESKNGKKPKYKFYWQCNCCKQWYRDVSQIEVDHINEIGPFENDWNLFIEKMYFCGQENLQALCLVCHSRKTSIFASAISRYKRKQK